MKNMAWVSDNCPKITHTGEAPYLCEICNKRFTFNENLQKHRRSHVTEEHHTHCRPNVTSSAKNFKLYAGTQTQCLEIQNQSSANLPLRFTTWRGTGVIDERNERMLSNMHSDSCEKTSHLAKFFSEEWLSISITTSPEAKKPFLEKSFGCGLCGEMFLIEKEFQDHCSVHRFSAPDDSFVDF